MTEALRAERLAGGSEGKEKEGDEQAWQEIDYDQGIILKIIPECCRQDKSSLSGMLPLNGQHAS